MAKMLKKKFLPSPLHCDKSVPTLSLVPIRVPRGLFVVGLFVRVVWQVWMMRLTGRDRSGSLGRLLRSDFERLGGFWIKAGRILAARRDAYPETFCAELAEIRDGATMFSGDVVEDIIESEVGGSTMAIFREFDVVPIATSSFRQVHAAWLRGQDVKIAIKIQRPDIRKWIVRDLRILSRLVSFLRIFSLCRWAKLDELEAESRRVVALELDYRILANAMRRMRRNLASKKVYIPKVFPSYCTERVLVMEFIDGVSVVDYHRALASTPKRTRKWCRQNAIDSEKLRQRIKEFAGISWRCRHSDIMLLRKNRIALVDVGIDRSSGRWISREKHGLDSTIGAGRKRVDDPRWV